MAHGVDPYPGPGPGDVDDDALLSSFFFSSCARRSPQLQVFPDAGAITRREMVGLPIPTDPWLMSLWIAGMGRVWSVTAAIPTGYPCGFFFFFFHSCSYTPQP